MTRLLIIGYVWPEPDSSAAGSRMMQLIQCFLQQQWHITFASQAADSDHMADLETLGIQKAHIEVNNSDFDRFVSDYQPDIVLFDRFMMEEQFGWRVEEQCPGALRMLESSDLHCLRHARQLAHRQQRTVNQQDYHSDMAKREIASILRCDMSLIISEHEMQHLQDVYQVDPGLLHYIPLMVEPVNVNERQASLPDFSHRQHFIFIGNYLHAPNWDAVQYLKQTIWPAIRQQLPQAEINIFGAYTPEKARQLHKPSEGFNIAGWAPEVKQVMMNARVNLAPLRYGAGMKGKLIDAMCYGTPSASTRIGAEGMHGDMPWCGIIADDAEAFASAAARLYQQQDEWEVAQRNGFDIIQARHNKNELSEVLSQQIEGLKKCLQQHRLNNFTGAMLAHHHMKSTRYMSKWIEEKNKHKN